MSREMKYSGTDWIGEIPVQWELAPTKRVFRGKKRIVGDEADNYERLALTLNGVVKRTKDDNEGLQPEQFNNYQILEKNELVFKLIDLQNIRTSRVGLSPYTGIVSPAYIILSNSETDNRFYYYWFMDMYNRCIFNQMGDDGVRSALNIKDVLEIPLPLISESTRIKIASFLDRKCAEIDEMIALQEKIVEELKAYKQSVITEAVTKGLNPDAPMKDSGIEWIGEIPEHWKMCRVKDILEAGKDGIKIGPFGSSLTNKVNGEGECKIYGQWNIVNKDFTAGKNFVSAETYRELDAYKIVAGDILVSMMGTIGKCAIIPNGLQDGIMDSHVIKIRINKNIINPEFFELMYDKDNSTFIFEQLSRMKKGSIMDGLNSSIVKRLNLLLPPINEQQEIASYLLEKRSQIDNLISIKLSKIDSLKEYKKSIIYEYVTGKKEVTE